MQLLFLLFHGDHEINFLVINHRLNYLNLNAYYFLKIISPLSQPLACIASEGSIMVFIRYLIGFWQMGRNTQNFVYH